MDCGVDIGITALLYRVAHKCMVMQSEKLKVYSVSPQQAVVLGTIIFIGKNNSVNQKAISREMHVKESSVSSIVKTMVKNGFISKEQSKDDARNYIIKLTDKGREIAYILKSLAEQVEEEIYERLSNDEKENLIKILKKLI
ncbi:MAG: winged helix DNA-binding protein [Clostridia bacterium]|nr:winged helix DNA-binding protein [Clostridia bacterium]